MQLILLIMGLLLLITVVFTFNTQKGYTIYLQAIILYLLLLISFTVTNLPFVLHLPIGIFIGYLFVKKVSNEKKRIVKISLVFSLISFIFIQYLTPSIPIKWLDDSIGIYQQVKKYESIDSLEVHSRDANIQKSINENNVDNVREDLTIILTYVLADHNIEIKDKMWLIHEARQELGIVVDVWENKDDYTIIYAAYKGIDYVGYVKKADTPYMEYVIKGKLK